jgi:hypothetical protein
MSDAVRDPDAILAELGGRLSDAFDEAERKSGWQTWSARRGFARLARRRSPRWAIAVTAGLLFAGPAAVATHDNLFTQPPPASPGLLGAPGAVTPDRTGVPVFVGSGERGGVGWRLSASVCRYGVVQAVGVFLDVRGGGAGARCDVASRLPGTNASPSALAQRRVQTYVDPIADRTWVFGVLPVGAATVEVRSRSLSTARGGLTTTRAATQAIDPRSVVRGIPAGLRVFVVSLPGARDVAGVDVSDGTGTPMLRCGRESLCLTVQSPSQESPT